MAAPVCDANLIDFLSPPNEWQWEVFRNFVMATRFFEGDYIRQYPKFCHDKPFLPLR